MYGLYYRPVKSLRNNASQSNTNNINISPTTVVTARTPNLASPMCSPCRCGHVDMLCVVIFSVFMVMLPEGGMLRFYLQGTRSYTKAVYYPRFFKIQRWTLFAQSVCNFIFELPCTSVESYVRLHVKTSLLIFSHYTETTRTMYDARHWYHVPGIYSKQQFTAGTPIVPLYEKSKAVKIEPRPPSRNTCRLCVGSSRTLFRPQASTRMQRVLGDSRASCRLSINSRAVSNSGSQQQHYEGSSPTPDDGSHIHRILPP